MNFFYFLVVFVVFNSTCNCEVVKPSADANSTSSAYRHLSVPWQIRLATMTVTCLFLSASIWLTTATFFVSKRLTRFGRIAELTALTVMFTIGYVGFGWFISGITVQLQSHPPLKEEQLSLLWWQQWVFSNLISFAVIVRLWPPNINFDAGNLPQYLFLINFTLNILFPLLILLGVYMKLFSALIPMGILLMISYVGAVLIESHVGQQLWHTATVNLMLFVDIQLLTTLSSALHEGKSIWPLISTLIKDILMIFTIRSISIEFICRWTVSQRVLESYMFRLLQFSLQLSLSSLLCYFICLIYSFSAQR